MLKRLAKELCIYILAGVIIWFCIITISGGESVKLGISEAVDRCMNIIIPSLFVFMALSQILVSSGLYYCVSMPFYPISRFIMGIPPQLFFVFLLGNTAGYPVGVKLLSDLCQRKIISQRTAKIMSCFCCCGGPAFYSGTVGLAVFGHASLLDYSDQEYTKYFFEDGVHIGKKGWAVINEDLYHFYQGHEKE